VTETPTSDAGKRVGERIREARTEANLSVRELARQIDVSSSHVSQVERGLASFSVAALYKVVSLLGISMDSLFEEPRGMTVEHPPAADADPQPESQGPLDESAVVLRAISRQVIPLSSGRRWERLTPKPEVGTEFIEVVYEPSMGRPTQSEFVQHAGREFGVVIEGSLTVEVGFDRTVLHVGDSIAFDSHRPHRFWNATSEWVRTVWFILDDQSLGESTYTRDSAALAALGRSAPTHGGEGQRE
jgi:transcriptional regulator with XRE-family HTH domain